MKSQDSWGWAGPRRGLCSLSLLDGGGEWPRQGRACPSLAAACGGIQGARPGLFNTQNGQCQVAFSREWWVRESQAATCPRAWDKLEGGACRQVFMGRWEESRGGSVLPCRGSLPGQDQALPGLGAFFLLVSMPRCLCQPYWSFLPCQPLCRLITNSLFLYKEHPCSLWTIQTFEPGSRGRENLPTSNDHTETELR